MVVDRELVKNYVSNQCDSFFPDGHSFRKENIDYPFDIAIQRMECCFKEITLPSFSNEEGQTFFSYLHTDQYAMFLYFLMNSIWTETENKSVCDKLMCLNRMLHGFFISYKCKMPKVFLWGHPVGSVFGNAQYGEYFFANQNVTVNTYTYEDGGIGPVIGKGVFIGAGAKIIGGEPIGNRVSIGVNAVVYNTKIEDDMVVYASCGGVKIKKRKKVCFSQQYFRTNLDGV